MMEFKFEFGKCFLTPHARQRIGDRTFGASKGEIFTSLSNVLKIFFKNNNTVLPNGRLLQVGQKIAIRSQTDDLVLLLSLEEVNSFCDFRFNLITVWNMKHKNEFFFSSDIMCVFNMVQKRGKLTRFEGVKDGDVTWKDLQGKVLK